MGPTALLPENLPHDFLNIVAMSLCIITAVAMFSWNLPRRDHFGRRLAVLLALWVVAVAAVVCVGLSVTVPSAVALSVAQLALFSAVLLGCTGAVRALFETSGWVALFCSTAGYTAQNLTSSTRELVLVILGATGAGPADGGLLASAGTWALSAALVLVPCYVLMARKMDRNGLSQVEDRSMLAMMAVVSLVVIGFDLTVKLLAQTGVPTGFVVVLRLFHLLVCVFTLGMEYVLLYRRHLEQDMSATERLLAEHERQYRLSRENIEAINVKCHDLKHQIRSLGTGGAVVGREALDDLARDVAIYDSSVKTGNEALDTILTEKGLVCERRGIGLTCMADGSALAHVAAADLYALFGNALDNAIEAVGGLSDPTRRSVSLTVRQVAGVTSIHVENFFSGRLEFGADGLPRTTKVDRASHGFGTRSMRRIAERYGGTLSTVAEGDVFRLDVIIPSEG